MKTTYCTYQHKSDEVSGSLVPVPHGIHLSTPTMLRNIAFIWDHGHEVVWTHEVISEMILELKGK